MALPEILPVLTSDRVMWEVRPTTKPAEGDTPAREVYDWFPVRTLGQRLTANVSPVDYLKLREARRIDDTEAQIDAVLELARVEVFHKGAAVGGAERIPEAHRPGLFLKVVGLSSVGSDPFGEAPAGSLP